MNKIKALPIAVVMVVVIAAAAFYSSRSHPQPVPLSPPPAPVAVTPAPVPAAPKSVSIPGWKTCNYPSFGYEFQYPSDWVVQVFSSHPGLGGIPTAVECGVLNEPDITGELTLLPAHASSNPPWALPNVGMQIFHQTPFTTSLHSVVSTTTVNGVEAAVLKDGSIVIRGYVVSFGPNTPKDIRDSIMSTFGFL